MLGCFAGFELCPEFVPRLSERPLIQWGNRDLSRDTPIFGTSTSRSSIASSGCFILGQVPVVSLALSPVANYAPTSALIRVSKARRRDIAAWNEALHLERLSGRAIEDLRQRSTADRWQLANVFRRQGDRMMSATPPFYRDAVSRFYYSMYHAMRAVVFFVHGGDDHQEHSTLPAHTPADFTNAAIWQNALKDARERRNAADYDPYPKADRAHRAAALQLQGEARELLRLSREYLRSKGCAHL